MVQARHIFILLVGILNLLPLYSDLIPYFTPPHGWEDADPKLLAPMVKMGYYGKAHSNFHPSINIAVENIDNMSHAKYLKVVKKIHQQNKNNTWRKLGDFQTRAGKATLTEITTKNQVGRIKMLQMIFTKDKHAYILTGASLDKDFPKVRNTLVKAFRTFSLTNDLIKSLKDVQREKTLSARLNKIKEDCLSTDFSEKAKKEEIFSFHKHVTSNYQDMGAYWQYLILKELHDAVVEKQNKQ